MSKELARAKARAHLADIVDLYDVVVVELGRAGAGTVDMQRVNNARAEARVLWETLARVHRESPDVRVLL